jgi:D-amino peptidase
MKILIAADMEGISGVVHWDQVSSDRADYARFRKLMTAEVNAAVQGAFAGGAAQVVVSDGHGSGRNILIEELDSRARLNSGGPSPLSMVEGAGSGVSGAIFVGYHARAGTPGAILDHTWAGAVAELWLNRQAVGEIGLNAGVCGHFGAPVIALSGCRAACAEAAALLGEIETVPVKDGTGRMAAECLAPAVAQERVRDAATRAVARLKSGQGPRPWSVPPPIEVTVEFIHSDFADRASLLPGARREGRRVSCAAEDMPAAYRAFRALVSLA